MVLSEDDTKKCFREDVAKRAPRSVPSICRTRWPERGDKRPGDKDDTNVAELIGTSSGLRKHASFIKVTYNNDHPLLKYGLIAMCHKPLLFFFSGRFFFGEVLSSKFEVLRTSIL